MRAIRISIVVLLGAVCVANAQPADKLETVEDHWPNGQLRLRKQVLHREDGTVVDHGSFERWHDNGEKEYEAVFVNGKKEGTTIRYHKNGRKASQQEYKDGERHGRCVSWDDSGRMVKEENWADGKPHGTWRVWQDGKVKWSHIYVHGKP
jgi:antitoxin component YwqK of YwqJK toxin-antitoxin module